MKDVQIGVVTHYFDKIGVAVIDVTQPISVGDHVKISGHDQEFTQEVGSLQIEHAVVDSVGKGESCGLKVDQPVREGDVLYRV